KPTISMTLQWVHDGVPVSGATNTYLSVSNAKPEDAGSYVLTASGPQGSSSSSPIRLNVLAQPLTTTLVGGWGEANYGQYFPPNQVREPRAIAAGNYHTMALNGDGTVVVWGKNTDGESTVPTSATNVTAIAAGGNHCLAVRRDGMVVGWGRNWDGQTD